MPRRTRGRMDHPGGDSSARGGALPHDPHPPPSEPPRGSPVLWASSGAMAGGGGRADREKGRVEAPERGKSSGFISGWDKGLCVPPQQHPWV